MIQQLKSRQNIAFLALIIVVLGLQFYYIVSVQSKIRAEILAIQQESEIKKLEIMAQEKKLRELPQFEQELEQVNSQVNGVTSMIPTMTSQLEELIEFNRLMEANGFKDLVVQQLGQVLHEDETSHIIESQYQLIYTSTYNETKDFIQNLCHSNQLINLISFEMDNSPQTLSENKAYYGSHMKELVQSKVVVSTFSLKGEPTGEEVYIPYMTPTTHVSKSFVSRKGVVQQEVAEQEGREQREIEELTPIELQQARNETNQFYLRLWDILVSGQNVTLSGPAPLERSFTGMRSGENVSITLTLREGGYDVSLEDEGGQVRQNSVEYTLENPQLTIDCNIDRIQEVMPEIKIYIRNYTDQMLEISPEGDNLDLITIYNEYDEKVRRGETKGKVRLN